MRHALKPEDGPTPLQWMLSELDSIKGCDRTKQAVREVLRGMVGQRVYITRRDLVQPAKKLVARRLIETGFTAPEARAELVARLGVSRRTAERLVSDALAARAHEQMAKRQTSFNLEGA